MSRFQFWLFSPFFVLLKVTCLVTLFDRKLQIFKNSPKLTILCIFKQLLSNQIVNIARFARNVECDIFGDFQTLCWIVFMEGNLGFKSGGTCNHHHNLMAFCRFEIPRRWDDEAIISSRNLRIPKLDFHLRSSSCMHDFFFLISIAFWR